MPLTKPNQELRQDLKWVAFSLEDICVELGALAQRLSDADALALTRRIGRLYEDADCLRAYADEVKKGVITRAKPE